MVLLILQHTPVWVWGLFAALVAIGFSQTHDRDVSVFRLTALPLLLVALSLSGVLRAFGHMPIAFAGWGAGLAFALGFVRQHMAVRGAAWLRDTQRIRVPGSWLPLGLIVGLFTVKYLAGASLAMVPALASEPVFAGGCSLLYGLFSGLFLARALSLRRLAREPANAQLA